MWNTDYNIRERYVSIIFSLEKEILAHNRAVFTSLYESKSNNKLCSFYFLKQIDEEYKLIP